MRRGASLSRKITTLILFIIIICISAVGVFSFMLYRGDSIEINAEKALSVAQTVAAFIDPDEMESIMSAGEKTPYWDQTKAFLDDVKESTGAAYLYVLDSEYSDVVTYFMEATVPGSDYEPVDLCENEDASVHDDKLFEVIATGNQAATDIYESEGFGTLISGYAPIKDERGVVVGVVGADLSVSSVLASSNSFGVSIIIMEVVMVVIFCSFTMWYMRRNIGRPIQALTEASRKIENGDMDVRLSIQSRDEIGTLALSFQKMADSTKKQAEALDELAGGNLSIQVTPRCDQDTMSNAMIKMIDNLNTMFFDINTSANYVSSGAEQIANAAQILAEGAAEQTASIRNIGDDMDNVKNQVDESAGMARNAVELSASIKNKAQKGSGQMTRMIEAVEQINSASHSINNVIKVIDDIAFQTNILALNAAVEAARAGQHGKGFAVVAEEVRSLAAKSSAAAKDSEGLILNSIGKAKLGAEIAGETATSFAEIVMGVEQSGQIVGEIAQRSELQRAAIENIHGAMNHVTQVAQQNNAAAQESASSSQELSSQSDVLRSMVSSFKLRDSDMITGRTPSSRPVFAERSNSKGRAPELDGFGKY